MTIDRNNSDSFSPKPCASAVNSSLTHSGTFVFSSAVALPMRAGNPVEREKLVPWESLAVASLWRHCSGVVAADLRALADELVALAKQVQM